jgi:hypothetical protein
LNIEFETKRKFYYYSDELIDALLKFTPRPGLPQELNRLFRIIDNRSLFLEYMTRETLAFIKERKKDGTVIYMPWWERLRNTKLDGITSDTKLLRKYSKDLDEKLIRKRMINNVAVRSVYNGRVNTDFSEDMSDMLSNLNDNHARDLNDYLTVKEKKQRALKNRIEQKARKTAAKEEEKIAEHSSLIQAMGTAVSHSSLLQGPEMQTGCIP